MKVDERFDVQPGDRYSDGVHGVQRRGVGAPPPIVLVLLGIVTTQVGAAIAKQLFPIAGPAGTVLLRTGFAALSLVLLWRPRIRGYPRKTYLVTALFGLSLAAMNLTFYASIDRIPLGIAVTLEFLGPLAVAVAGSRRAMDLLWVILAAAGIALLAPVAGFHVDLQGLVFALMAGLFWAFYILLSARVGRAISGGAGLALALTFGTILLAPVGLATAGTSLLDVGVLLAGLGLALLSSAIPYSLELEALRQLPTRVFGVLMSLEPAIAAVVGFVLLRQALGLRAIVAIGLVTVASIGASRFRSAEEVM